MSGRIHEHYGVIIAVGVDIQTIELGRFCIVYGIGRNKATYFGIVVARFEIIKLGFRIIVVTAVTERVQVADEGRRRHFRYVVAIVHFVVTPRVVIVLRHRSAGGVDDRNDVALQILLVEVRLPLVREAHNAGMVVHKMQAVTLFDQVILTIVDEINAVLSTFVAKSVISKRISSEFGSTF